MATVSSSSTSNTTMGPMPCMGDTPVIDAWKKALETYKKSLPKKDHKVIQMPSGPGDVVKDIVEWELKQRKSKSRKVATAIGGGLARLQRFSASIDMLAQGSPAPGCLLWGSIKLVLTVCDFSQICYYHAIYREIHDLAVTTQAYASVCLYAVYLLENMVLPSVYPEF